MRSRALFVAVTAATAAMLVVAAPAHADVLTTTDVTDVEVVHATPATFSYGNYPAWEPEGPAVFPSTVVSGTGSDNYTLQGYRPVLPTLGAGCTRTIDAFAIDYRSLISTVGPSQASFYVGLPASVVPVEAEFDGTGSLSALNDFFVVSAVGGENSGTVSFALDTPVSDATELFGWIGFFTDYGVTGDPLFSVDRVAFTTTTTCPDPVVVPVDTAPAADLLPDTGLDTATAISAGGAAVALIALGTTMLLLRRRKAADAA